MKRHTTKHNIPFHRSYTGTNPVNISIDIGKRYRNDVHNMKTKKGKKLKLTKYFDETSEYDSNCGSDSESDDEEVVKVKKSKKKSKARN